MQFSVSNFVGPELTDIASSLTCIVVMALVMNLVLRWPLFTGSLSGLYVTTLAVTIPLAWLLHRFTRIDRRLRPTPEVQAPTTPAPVPDAMSRPSPAASARPRFASSLRE